jgi:hypothetical protein
VTRRSHGDACNALHGRRGGREQVAAGERIRTLLLRERRQDRKPRPRAPSSLGQDNILRLARRDCNTLHKVTSLGNAPDLPGYPGCKKVLTLRDSIKSEFPLRIAGREAHVFRKGRWRIGQPERKNCILRSGSKSSYVISVNYICSLLRISSDGSEGNLRTSASYNAAALLSQEGLSCNHAIPGLPRELSFTRIERALDCWWRWRRCAAGQQNNQAACDERSTHLDPAPL